MTQFFTDKDQLSNWYIAPFEVKGVHFNCVEQMMMYSKAKLFGNEEVAAQVLLAQHPRDQKALGRKVRGYQDDVWSRRRVGIVTKGCYAKFSQNPESKAALLATQNTILVEASPYDRIWGVGLSMDDERITDQRN